MAWVGSPYSQYCDVPDELSHVGHFLERATDANELSGAVRSRPNLDVNPVFICGDTDAIFYQIAGCIFRLSPGAGGVLAEYFADGSCAVWQLEICEPRRIDQRRCACRNSQGDSAPCRNCPVAVRGRCASLHHRHAMEHWLYFSGSDVLRGCAAQTPDQTCLERVRDTRTASTIPHAGHAVQLVPSGKVNHVLDQ